ncbi:MAG: hypothetical protein AAFY54_01985 [Cyanobacteria bacterium J06648_10]
MTALNRNNIPDTITTLEGLMAWCASTYSAAYGGKQYGERTNIDLQSFGRNSIVTVAGEENNTSTFLVGRFAVPLNPQIAAATNPVWLEIVEHAQSVSLPSGYTV